MIATEKNTFKGVPRSPQISRVENFATIVNHFQLLTIAIKLSILDVCRGRGFVSDSILTCSKDIASFVTDITCLSKLKFGFNFMSRLL